MNTHAERIVCWTLTAMCLTVGSYYLPARTAGFQPGQTLYEKSSGRPVGVVISAGKHNTTGSVDGPAFEIRFADGTQGWESANTVRQLCTANRANTRSASIDDRYAIQLAQQDHRRQP